MATTQTLHDQDHVAVMKFHFDDGSAETNVLKVDVSGLADNRRGQACTQVAIERIWYNISSDINVDIIWDATANVTALTLGGDGMIDLRSVGPIENTAGAGKTGDVLFSTIGTVAATSRYSIILELRKVF
jgi:hypothetical protein